MSNQENILEWMSIIDAQVDSYTEYILSDEYEEYVGEREVRSHKRRPSSVSGKIQKKLLIIHKKDEGCILSQPKKKYRVDYQDFRQVIFYLRNVIPEKTLLEFPKSAFSKIDESIAFDDDSIQRVWCFHVEPNDLLKLIEERFSSIQFVELKKKVQRKVQTILRKAVS